MIAGTTFKFTRIVLLCLVGIIVTSPTSFADEDTDKVIAFRKHVMTLQGRTAVILRQIANGEVDQDEHFTRLANIMADSIPMIPSSFEENTVGQSSDVETRVKENTAIWDNWDEFMELTNKLQSDSQRVADLANAGDMDGAKAALGTLFTSCRDCHKGFQD